mgnify:CR=1 FL=1
MREVMAADAGQCSSELLNDQNFTMPIEVIEEFGCSTWLPIWLESQSEMHMCIETHLAP